MHRAEKRAIREMVRVTRPGGSVGIHDVCWTQPAPEQLKSRLEVLEGEHPESLEGWAALFRRAGLGSVTATGKSNLMKAWMKDVRKRVDLRGWLRIATRIFKMWGIAGFIRIWESQKIFESQCVRYGIIMGRKR